MRVIVLFFIFLFSARATKALEPEALAMLNMPSHLEYAPTIDGMQASLLLKSITNSSNDFGTYAIYFEVEERKIINIYLYKHVYKYKKAELRIKYDNDGIAFRQMKVKREGCKFDIDISPAKFKIWPCDNQFRARLSSIFIKNVELNEFNYIIDENDNVVFFDQRGNRLIALEINLPTKKKFIVTKDSEDRLHLFQRNLYDFKDESIKP